MPTSPPLSSRVLTERAFDAVRRRADLGGAFVVAAHGALGAVFGTMLARTGDGGPWSMAILGLLAAAGAAAWEAARRPAVAVGRLIEARFPECGNVLVTADEVLSGALDVNEAAAARVFDRAAAVLATIEPAKAAMILRRTVVSLLVIAASLAYVIKLWRDTL
jgi:hypothetical protein